MRARSHSKLLTVARLVALPEPAAAPPESRRQVYRFRPALQLQLPTAHAGALH